MKVGIIGYGYVGQDTHAVLRDCEVLKVDPLHSGLSLQELLSEIPAVIFVCLPTPSGAHGACDDLAVMNCMRELVHYQGTVVIRSTVPVETVNKIKDFRSAVVYWPEFLRQKDLSGGAVHRLTVVGCDVNVIRDTFLEFLAHHAGGYAPAFTMSAVEASIYKYASNAFLATKVVFFHELRMWADRAGANWDVLSYALGADPRIGPSHIQAPGEDGWGFAGACFPKDCAALAFQAQIDGEPLTLIESVNEINSHLRALNEV